MPTSGLRERKKQRTRQAISDAAIRLILDRGFAQVSVAEIADAAEVSKPTLFKYFPTKEDLIVDRISDHLDEFAVAVRNRLTGETPLDALRRHTLQHLDEREPFTGLNDDPDSLRLREIIFTTPSLAAHLLRFSRVSGQRLAEALAEAGVDEFVATIAAAQIMTVHLVLAEENWRELAAGKTAAELHPVARTAATRAFDMLAGGLVTVGV